MNVSVPADEVWFVLIVSRQDGGGAQSLGRSDLMRINGLPYPAKLMANMQQLTANHGTEILQCEADGALVTRSSAA